MLYAKGRLNEEGIENGVYGDSEDGLDHKAIENHLDGNEANKEEIETAQDAEFSPAMESAFISAISENFSMNIPSSINLRRENMQLEGSMIEDCSFLVTEAMCKKYMYDTQLIENAAMLEGARLDTLMRNLLENGRCVDAIVEFVMAHDGDMSGVLNELAPSPLAKVKGALNKFKKTDEEKAAAKNKKDHIKSYNKSHHGFSTSGTDRGVSDETKKKWQAQRKDEDQTKSDMETLEGRKKSNTERYVAKKASDAKKAAVVQKKEEKKAEVAQKKEEKKAEVAQKKEEKKAATQQKKDEAVARRQAARTERQAKKQGK